MSDRNCLRGDNDRKIRSHSGQTLDPILTLEISLDDESSSSNHHRHAPDSEQTRVSSDITSLCFFKTQRVISTSGPALDSEDSDSEASLDLQCEKMLQSDFSRASTKAARQISAALELTGRCVGTCHSNGANYLWDLGQRKILTELTPNRGQGLTLRRVEDTHSFIYQTRDAEGTVSLHDLANQKASRVASFQTGSQSHCAASPCLGNPNLVALPSLHEQSAVVRDWRIPSTHTPVVTLASSKSHGMLTSLAMATAASNNATFLTCGMESGTMFCHDLAMPGRVMQTSFSAVVLGQDPILCLDTVPLESRSLSNNSSFVTVAGLAGNAEDLLELPPEERGRIVLTTSSIPDQGSLHTQLHSRVQVSSGKPGKGICRFRPGGKIVAVGGWDYRLRLFDRRGTQLAILRGHVDSVNAMDWSHDAEATGFFGSGSRDGKLHIWRCYEAQRNR